MSRKGIVLLMAAALVFCFTGCGKKEEAPRVTQASVEDNSGLENPQAQRSRTFFTDSINGSSHPVRVLMGVQNGENTERVELGIKNNQRYIDFIDGEAGHVTIIFMEDAVYTVNHEDKTAVKTYNIGEVSGLNPLEELAFKDGNFANADILNGQDDINGKTYEYEEFVNGSTSLRLFFEGDVCKAIKSIQEDYIDLILIYEYDQNVLDSKLQVPEGYSVTEF